MLDAEAGVLVDEGFGRFGPLGALRERGGGFGGRLEVILDGVAEDGHVGVAGSRRPWRCEGAARLGAIGGARGRGRGLRDGLAQGEQEVQVVGSARHGWRVGAAGNWGNLRGRGGKGNEKS